MVFNMDDPLSRLPGYVLRRASIATMARLHDHLAAHDLRATEASLVMLIGDREGITQSEAGRVLGIKRANMVPLTAKLEARGLLTRSQMDGRSQGLALTKAGLEILRTVRAVIAKHEDETMKRVPEELRVHVVPILTAIWGQDGP
jgi:DNA-binding MarR family transcriptional regulator